MRTRQTGRFTAGALAFLLVLGGLGGAVQGIRGETLTPTALLTLHPVLASGGGVGSSVSEAYAVWWAEPLPLPVMVAIAGIVTLLLLPLCGPHCTERVWLQRYAIVVVLAASFYSVFVLPTMASQSGMYAATLATLAAIVGVAGLYRSRVRRRAAVHASVLVHADEGLCAGAISPLRPENVRAVQHRTDSGDPEPLITTKVPGRPVYVHAPRSQVESDNVWRPKLKLNPTGALLSRTRAHSQAPFGKFQVDSADVEKFLFLASGAGITPVLSMLWHLRDRWDMRPALVMYENQNDGEILLRRELDSLPLHVQVVYVLSHPPADWDGVIGELNADAIRQYGWNYLGDCHVFVAGSQEMMARTVRALWTLGIPGERIHYEHR